MTRNQAALRIVPTSSEEVSVRTPLGASATAEGDKLVVRDPGGAIVVVYDAATGSATIAAPAGDLHLAARGKVVVEAGTDLELSSRATTRIRAVELDSDADVTRFRSKAIDVATGVMQATAQTVVLGVGRWNMTADRVMERANDVYRTVQGVIETRAGRLRSLVRETTQVRSGATSITSKEDTFIDGRRVLLG
jgi:hypothetical protein